jgi:hypothetical protein
MPKGMEIRQDGRYARDGNEIWYGGFALSIVEGWTIVFVIVIGPI